MASRRTRECDCGEERRSISWGEGPDGHVWVRETSSGPDTRVSFGAAWRETVVTFQPTDLYGIADVDHAANSAGDDLFIGDIEDALSLWGVPYSRESRLGPSNP